MTHPLEDPESNLYSYRYQIKSGHEKYATSIKISPDSQYIATASADKTIKIFNFETGKLVRTLIGHTKGVNDISWAPDSQHIASASDDLSVKIWDIEFGECIKTLNGHTYHATCVSFNFKGNLLISGSADEAIRIWDTLNGRCLKILSAHSDPIESVDLCWDGTIIASGSYDGLIRLFDTETGQCLKTLIYNKGGSSFPVSQVRFSPNGKYLLATTLDNNIRLWDYQNNRVVKTFQGAIFEKLSCTSRFVTAFEGSCLIASGSESGEVFIWDLNSKRVLDTIKLSNSPVLGIDIQGDHLVTLAIDGVVNSFKVKKSEDGSSLFTDRAQPNGKLKYNDVTMNDA